jgi:hypothetical protein
MTESECKQPTYLFKFTYEIFVYFANDSTLRVTYSNLFMKSSCILLTTAS